MPVGIASCWGPDGKGLSLWTLNVVGCEIPGRWVITDGEFKPSE
jgi:hypothetical protein